MEYSFLKDLAIIIIFAKCCGIVARKLKAPSVVGEILAGLIIGPSILGLVDQSEFLVMMAEIGVILMMFSAGLETNLKELIKTGPIALAIACCGVFIPLAGGTLLYWGFYGMAPTGSHEFYKAIFIGVIMTATSVSITVQSLKEMGKLKGKVGTTILSAAIIDDVIGIIVLTIVLGVSSGSGGYFTIIVKIIAFFIFAIIGGYLIYKFFSWYDKRHPHSRRIPIYALGVALIFAYAAEKFFGIADITGAYIAGIVLCSLSDASYMESKIDINSYMFFSPIFFASIGLKTNLSGMDMSLLWFAIAFVIVGCISKIIGCSGVSKLLGFNGRESLQIGYGMMVRGEVALIVATKGLSVGLIESKYFTSVILLIIISSVLVPIFLKKSFSKEQNQIIKETN